MDKKIDIPTRLSKELTDKFVVENNTLKRDVKDNPKDRITLEVGDSKSTDFKPQRKVMRWDNEVNISMRFPEDANAVVETEKEVIKYVAPDGYEVHQLEKPEAGEDGGHEIIAKFATLQSLQDRTSVVDDNYRLVMTTQFKNVVGYKQLPLTQEEIDEGASRPENVVNSIAFYHDSKGGMNDEAGMEYKVGKVGHQYRIKLIDANGNEVWGDQNWLPETNELELLLPKQWVDNAVYPVIVDPTFGYTGLGGSTGNATADMLLSQLGTPESDGTVDSISWGGRKTSGDSNNTIQGAIYSDGYALAAPQTEQVTVNSTTKQFWTMNFTGGPSVVAATDYRPFVFIDAATSTMVGVYAYDSPQISDAGKYKLSVTFNTWPDPISSPSAFTSGKFSIYATYTATTPTTVIRSASQNSATSGTAISVAAPAGVGVGDVVVVITNVNGTETTTVDNNGSTPFTKDGEFDEYAPPTQSQTNSITIFTRTIQAGDPATYNFTAGSSQRWGVVAFAVLNPDTGGFYDVSPAVANRNEGGNDGNPIDSPSINTNSANALHIALGIQDSPSTSVVGTPTGYTKIEEALNQPVSVYYKIITSAGASGAASSFDWDQNGTKAGFSFAIKQIAASGGGGDPTTVFIPQRMRMGMGL